MQASAIPGGGEEVHLWGGGGGGGGGGDQGGDPCLGPTRGAQHARHQVPPITAPGASVHPGKEKHLQEQPHIFHNCLSFLFDVVKI